MDSSTRSAAAPLSTRSAWARSWRGRCMATAKSSTSTRARALSARRTARSSSLRCAASSSCGTWRASGALSHAHLRTTTPHLFVALSKASYRGRDGGHRAPSENRLASTWEGRAARKKLHALFKHRYERSPSGGRAEGSEPASTRSRASAASSNLALARAALWWGRAFTLGALLKKATRPALGSYLYLLCRLTPPFAKRQRAKREQARGARQRCASRCRVRAGCAGRGNKKAFAPYVFWRSSM